MEREVVRPSVVKPGSRGETRRGRGWSKRELKEAVIDTGLARKLRLPIDNLRRTIHDANVQFLKELKSRYLSKVSPEASARKSNSAQGSD